MSQELNIAPCPFCGSTPRVQKIGNEHTRMAVTIRCPECRIERTDATPKAHNSGNHDWLVATATKNWNRRAPAAQPPSISPEIRGIAAQQAGWVPPELGNAFMTLEGSGGEGRNIVLKFNQRDDAYVVHDFLLKGGSKEWTAPAEAESVRDIVGFVSPAGIDRLREPGGSAMIFADEASSYVPLCRALQGKPEAIPKGAARMADGTTYYDIAEVSYQAEQCDALHMWLDDQGVPRSDEKGELSPVGRVVRLLAAQADISRDALELAMTICDAVPTRAHLSDDPLGHIGKLVNAQDDGAHGYAVIRDALKAIRAIRAKPEAAKGGE